MLLRNIYINNMSQIHRNNHKISTWEMLSRIFAFVSLILYETAVFVVIKVPFLRSSFVFFFM